MGEAELEKQRNMVTRSSIKRKPFANLTNIVRKPYPISPFSQSKKPGSSTASDSSIGSTQNPIHENHPLITPPDHSLPSTPPTLSPAHLFGDEIAQTQRRINRKEVAVPLCSSTKRNQSSLNITTNDRNEISVPPHISSIEQNKNKRIATDVSITTHHMKNTKNTTDTPIRHSALKINDKGKGIAVQSNHLHKENINLNLPHTLLNRKDKGKSIAVSPDYYPPMKPKMAEVLERSSGVILKDKGKSIAVSPDYFPSMKPKMAKVLERSTGVILKDKGKSIAVSPDYYPSMKPKMAEVLERSSSVILKDKGKAVDVTPINHRTLKYDKGNSCPPLLKTAKNRNTENAIQSKLQTEPPPNKKKRCSSKESVEEYVLPKDFVEQQRAYFKEIDDFELEVEEV